MLYLAFESSTSHFNQNNVNIYVSHCLFSLPKCIANETESSLVCIADRQKTNLFAYFSWLCEMTQHKLSFVFFCKLCILCASANLLLFHQLTFAPSAIIRSDFVNLYNFLHFFHSFIYLCIDESQDLRNESLMSQHKCVAIQIAPQSFIEVEHQAKSSKQ